MNATDKAFHSANELRAQLFPALPVITSENVLDVLPMVDSSAQMGFRFSNVLRCLRTNAIKRAMAQLELAHAELAQ